MNETTSFDVLQTRNLQIVDKLGNVRIQMNSTEDGGCSLEFRYHNGIPALQIIVENSGAKLSMFASKGVGGSTVEAIASDDIGVSVALKDRNGRSRIQAEIDLEGAPVFSIFSAEGNQIMKYP